MTIETTETVGLTLDSPRDIQAGDELLSFDAGRAAVKTKEPFVVATVTTKPMCVPGDPAFIVTGTEGETRFLQDLAVTVRRTEQRRWVVRATFESRFAIGDRVVTSTEEASKFYVREVTFRSDGTAVYGLQHVDWNDGSKLLRTTADQIKSAPVYFEDDAEPQAGEVWITQGGVCLLAGWPGDVDRFGERGRYADWPWPDNQRWMSFGATVENNLTWHCSPGDYPLRRLVDANGRPRYLDDVEYLHGELAKESERRTVARRTSDERYARIQQLERELLETRSQLEDLTKQYTLTSQINAEACVRIEALERIAARAGKLDEDTARYRQLRQVADEYIEAVDHPEGFDPRRAPQLLERLRTAVRLPGGP